jgi:hypothetical protein
LTTPNAAPAQIAALPAASPGPSDGARKSALLLHALPRSDRAWLMERLPEPERAALSALLAELESLGIPADRALVEEALTTARGPEAGPSAGGAGNPEAVAMVALAAASPERLAAVLSGEPVALLVRFLEMSDWPWREELLEHLGSARRLQLHALLREAGSSGAGSGGSSGRGALLREQLADSVLRRLRREEELAPEPVRSRSLLARILQKGAQP